MHILMLVIALWSAIVIRWLWQPQAVPYGQRWQRSLFYFLFPPLLLLMTTIAVLGMGMQGQMLGMETSSLSYGVSLLFIGGAFLILLWQWYQTARSRWQIQQYSTATVAGYQAQILPTKIPYSAQIGWWHPQLVISEGLRSRLDKAHLEAVIAHENAHLYYRDTFWFFWLGWLYRITAWLPNSHFLWEELLLLRELRADSKATETVDFLLLAESLVTVAQLSVDSGNLTSACLSGTATQSRLEERIEALINQENAITPPLTHVGRELVWTLTPLFTMPWHHC